MAKVTSSFYYFCLLAVTLVVPYSLFNRSVGMPNYIWHLNLVPQWVDPTALGATLFVGTVLSIVGATIFPLKFLKALALCFHITTGFATGIWYWGTAIAAVFFLVIIETIKTSEQQLHYAPNSLLASNL